MSFFSRLRRPLQPPLSRGSVLAGQVWRYHTRPNEDGSTLLVLSVETVDGETVIHVRVRGVALQSAPGCQPISVVGHMPLSWQSFEQSVTSRLGASECVPDHSEALTIWREGGGGIWAVPLAAALDHTQTTFTTAERISPL